MALCWWFWYRRSSRTPRLQHQPLPQKCTNTRLSLSFHVRLSRLFLSIVSRPHSHRACPPSLFSDQYNSPSWDTHHHVCTLRLSGLVPAGGQRSAFRLMETLAMGVAPVIIGDDWELPFEGILDWRTFSVRVPFRDIHRVRRLRHPFFLSFFSQFFFGGGLFSVFSAQCRPARAV